MFVIPTSVAPEAIQKSNQSPAKLGMWAALSSQGSELRPAFATVAYPLCTQRAQWYVHKASRGTLEAGSPRREEMPTCMLPRGEQVSITKHGGWASGDAWLSSPFPPLAAGNGAQAPAKSTGSLCSRCSLFHTPVLCKTWQLHKRVAPRKDLEVTATLGTWPSWGTQSPSSLTVWKGSKNGEPLSQRMP